MKHHRRDRPKGLWTDEAICRESERWVHVSPSGVLVEYAARLLVRPRARRGTSRVWRSWPDRAGAEALILQTIEQTRAAGGTGLVWHTGDAVSPTFMGDALTQQGFEKTEDLDVLAFVLGTDPKLPDLLVPHDVSTRLVRDRDDLRLASVVEAGVFPASTWGKAATRAYMRGLSELDAHRQGRPGADGVSCALRYLALVRSRRGEGQEIAGTAGAEVAGETSGCGAPGRSRGTGAGAPTAPSWWRGAATPTSSAPPWPSPRPTLPHRLPSSGTRLPPRRQRTPLRPRDLRPGQHTGVAPGRHP